MPFFQFSSATQVHFNCTLDHTYCNKYNNTNVLEIKSDKESLKPHPNPSIALRIFEIKLGKANSHLLYFYLTLYLQ